MRLCDYVVPLEVPQYPVASNLATNLEKVPTIGNMSIIAFYFFYKQVNTLIITHQKSNKQNSFDFPILPYGITTLGWTHTFPLKSFTNFAQLQQCQSPIRRIVNGVRLYSYNQEAIHHNDFVQSVISSVNSITSQPSNITNPNIIISIYFQTLFCKGCVITTTNINCTVK